MTGLVWVLCRYCGHRVFKARSLGPDAVIEIKCDKCKRVVTIEAPTPAEFAQDAVGGVIDKAPV